MLQYETGDTSPTTPRKRVVLDRYMYRRALAAPLRLDMKAVQAGFEKRFSNFGVKKKSNKAYRNEHRIKLVVSHTHSEINQKTDRDSMENVEGEHDNRSITSKGTIKSTVHDDGQGSKESAAHEAAAAAANNSDPIQTEGERNETVYKTALADLQDLQIKTVYGPSPHLPRVALYAPCCAILNAVSPLYSWARGFVGRIAFRGWTVGPELAHSCSNSRE